ncbi:putative pyruvyl transferase [Blastococcus saxobsidens DD2]|uniref:Putative pyruvyl transferase n=1 Tax=Blastococcus saxobsidens (strain DD2) TaxID=1146883 RepID=H6RMX6_BLASD|nr:putative pyruvyl transferase [Blastococcus saxobsidens DD2]
MVDHVFRRPVALLGTAIRSFGRWKNQVRTSSRSLEGARRAQQRQESAPKRFVITNVFGDTNVGGAAITAATLEALLVASPGAQVAALPIDNRRPIDRSHQLTTSAYPELRWLPSPFPRSGPLAGIRRVARLIASLVLPGRDSDPPALKALRNADLVVSKGGYVFVDRDSIRSTLSMVSTIYPLLYAARHGVPTATFPTTVGPFSHSIPRAVVRHVLRRLDLVIARDPRSFDEALALGVPRDRVVSATDGVLHMAPPSLAAQEKALAKAGLQGQRFLVLTLRHIPEAAPNEKMFRAVEEASRNALDRSHVDRIVIAIHDEAERSHAHRLADALGAPATVLEEGWTPTGLIALYARAEVLLATRLHSAIFAFIAGTPAVAVSSAGTKTEGVYESLGLPGSWVMPLRDTTGSRLSAQMTEMAGESAARAQVQEAMERLRKNGNPVAAHFAALAQHRRPLPVRD